MRIFSHKILAPTDPSSPLFARATDADAAVCLPPLPLSSSCSSEAPPPPPISRVALQQPTRRGTVCLQGEKRKKERERERERRKARARVCEFRARPSPSPLIACAKKTGLFWKGGRDAAKHEGEEEEEWHAITAVAASFVGFYLSRFFVWRLNLGGKRKKGGRRGDRQIRRH